MRLLRWIKSAPAHPAPWDAATQRTVDESQAQEVCCHCSTPLSPGSWFCEHCGRAVGPYNNLMPRVNAFSEGEVYRCGAEEGVRHTPWLVIGYLLVSLNYLILAPLYWVLFFRNYSRPSCHGAPPGEDTSSP